MLFEFRSSNQYTNRLEDLELCPIAQPVYTCDLCASSYNDKHTLEYHLKVHIGISNGRIMCDFKEGLDNYNYDDQSRVKEIQNVNEDVDMNTLTEHAAGCNKVTSMAEFNQIVILDSNESATKTHTQVKNEVNTYTCSVCLDQFTTAISFREHYKIHSGEKPYKCGVCSAEFAKENQLTKHSSIHSHSGRQPMQRTNNRQPYKCEVCSATFTLERYLSQHLERHFTKPSISRKKPYICRECSAGFTNKIHLKTHSMTHRREKKKKKPMKCRIPSGETPCEFEVCSATCTNAGASEEAYDRSEPTELRYRSPAPPESSNSGAASEEAYHRSDPTELRYRSTAPSEPSGTLDLILRKLIGLEAAVQENAELLRLLTVPKHEPIPFDGLVMSPAQTEEEWTLLLESLEDGQIRRKMVQTLSALGGSNLGEFIRSVCRRLASNRIWSGYTLKGKTSKKPLEGCAIHSLIFAAAQNFQPTVTVFMINEILGVYLRNAPNKKGGLKHKDQGNRQEDG